MTRKAPITALLLALIVCGAQATEQTNEINVDSVLTYDAGDFQFFADAD